MEPTYLASESFGTSSRHYFIDFNVAANDSDYIRITRSDLQINGEYKRRSICVFEEDFHFLIESFSMVFSSVIQQRKGKVITDAISAGQQGSGIKSWPVAERPREKMITAGPSALGDAELLALLIGSGTVKHSALDLANMILEDVGYDLNALSELMVEDFCRFKGIGAAKAAVIVAALELNKRIVSS
ncbi:UPF0758 domain-containing protein [Pedobacter sp. MC2016-24]|uniref:UPF0758 domain-containing protein n=1 Tax=Pedobacter sp. MC2016-24 TaxID=2780090 RepID=UPI00187ECC5D|nr:UPF0758 domain-containing protein [Pedobacter sp. MC2016-24]MBE9599875.1 hypothetical protein [Pedobacter sp. MC2016-24]